MATQRVQSYLEKHRIGPLFESLMAKVIQDTPDDPVGYIIKVLQGIHKRQRIASDVGDHVSSLSRLSSRKSFTKSSQNGVNEMRGSRSNNLAASWSAGEAQLSSKSRDYPRPWTSNSKAANKTWSPDENARFIRGEQTQAAWNSDTRVPTHDFDEWYQLEHGDEQSSQTPQSKKYYGVKSWGTPDILEKTSQSRDSVPFSGDLDHELNLGQYKRSRTSPQRKDDILTPPPRSRPMKARRAVEEHRQQLQALLLEDTGKVPKKVKSLRHSPEEGMDILERMEDLQNEGVEVAANKGAKLNKAKQGKNGENVSVTICARCARIIGRQDDIDSSSQVVSTVSDFDSPPFDDIRKKEDDFFENIDSTSDVSEKLSSRRKNVWPMASDSESDATPRNNKVMFQRVKSPPNRETRHMYSGSSWQAKQAIRTLQRSRGNAASPELSSRPSSNRSNYSAPKGYLNAQRKFWATNGYSSDNETEMETKRTRTPRSINGRPWELPSDNNSDGESKSSRVGSPGWPSNVCCGHRKYGRRG